MSDQSPNSSAPVAPQAPADQSQSTAPAQGAAQSAEATLANPNATQAQKVAAVKKLNALKIKVDGQEYEERLPFEIDDTKENRDWMQKQLQMSKVAQKRMGEKAVLENEVREFFNQLKANPRKILADPNYGVDLKNLAKQILEEEISNASKSPEQLEKEKLQTELEELKDQRKKEKEESEQREYERQLETNYEKYDAQMTKVFESSDLPKSPYVIKKMTELMKIGVAQGLDISPADIMPMVREEILEDIRQMAQSMPLETIEKLFGGDILSKLRKKNISKAKAAAQVKAKAGDVGMTPKQPEKKEESPKKTIRQLWGV